MRTFYSNLRLPFQTLLVVIALAGCAGPQRVVEPVDPRREEEILFGCAVGFVEREGWPLLGADEMTGRLMTEWVESADGVRRRITALVFTHPRFGPGGTFDVQRESWDEPSETWGRMAPTRDDEALSRRMADEVTSCWERQSDEARSGQ